MSPTQWATFAAAIASITGGVFAMLRFVIKSYLIELKPNGGSSMRDSINVNTQRLERLELRVDEIFKILSSK